MKNRLWVQEISSTLKSSGFCTKKSRFDEPIFLYLLSEFEMHGHRIALSKIVHRSELNESLVNVFPGVLKPV